MCPPLLRRFSRPAVSTLAPPASCFFVYCPAIPSPPIPSSSRAARFTASSVPSRLLRLYRNHHSSFFILHSSLPIAPPSRAHRNKRNCASLYIVVKGAYYPNLITLQNYIIFLTLPNISPYIFTLPRIFHYYSHPRAPKVTKRRSGMVSSSIYLVGIHYISHSFAAAQGQKDTFFYTSQIILRQKPFRRTGKSRTLKGIEQQCESSTFSFDFQLYRWRN